MSEKRKILGQWWVPSDPKDCWTGTLILENGKSPRLDVTIPRGLFGINIASSPPPVLHGHDDQGRPVTLLFPGWAGSHGSMAMSRHKFSAGFVILGIHLSQASDLQLHKVSFGVQYFNEWLGISGFTRPPQNLSESWTINYRQPEQLIFSINPDLTVKIGTECSYKPERNKQVISENHQITFESVTGFNLAQLKELMVAVRQLLHFALLKPVYLLWANGEKAGHGYAHEGHFHSQDIEVWCSINRDPVELEAMPAPWLFNFKDVQSRFADFLRDWLKFLENQKEALGCYSATVYHRLPDSMEFLCLTQALEAYHGTKVGRQTFAKRIRALTSQFLPNLVGLVTDANAFAEQVRDNRNYYTHHDPTIKQAGRVVSGVQLYRLSEKLRLIFQMCVLTEMDIPADQFVRLRRQLATDIIRYT